LNAAITISPGLEMSIIGKDAMGFTNPPTMMLHAIGETKPWRNSFFIQLIKIGRKPGLADKAFFFNCKYPICIFSDFKYNLKKFDLRVASFFGRFLG